MQQENKFESSIIHKWNFHNSQLDSYNWCSVVPIQSVMPPLMLGVTQTICCVIYKTCAYSVCDTNFVQVLKL